MSLIYFSPLSFTPTHIFNNSFQWLGTAETKKLGILSSLEGLDQSKKFGVAIPSQQVKSGTK